MKIDLHCHSYYSSDGICSPKSIVYEASKKGLTGIAITDHNTTKGWEEAKKAAEEIGIDLILGEELKIKENGKTIGEILAYFINKEINPKGKTAEEAIREIKSQGGMAIIAHPYHWKKPFKKIEECKKLVDGMEAFNSRSQSKKGNDKAFKLAQANNLPMTAGSDAHTCFEIGRAYIECEAKTIDELKKMILEKKVKIKGKQTPRSIHIFAGLAKLFHLFYEQK